jgi:cytochrome oxidase assembly protein ShyY1
MPKRNNNTGMIFSFLFLFVLIAMLVFGHWQVRLQGKKIDELQKSVVENSQRTNNIVNFINSSLANIE